MSRYHIFSSDDLFYNRKNRKGVNVLFTCLCFFFLSLRRICIPVLTKKRDFLLNLAPFLTLFVFLSFFFDTLETNKVYPQKSNGNSQLNRQLTFFWSEKLKAESNEKSTLKFLNKGILKIGQTHPIWSTLESTVSDVRKGITKCRMSTGTYLLQTSQHKFSRSTISAACKCCGLNDEDLPHMLLECPTLLNQRKLFYPRIKKLVINNIGTIKWKELFNNRESIVRLILDCSSFTEILGKSVQTEIQRISTEMCHRIPPNEAE